MTNNIALRTTEEFMADYTPSYAPIMPLFMGKSKSYSVDAGLVNFKTATTIGDIRNKMVTPKDTELHQITSKEGVKDFKKYFFGSQYVQSQLQDVRGYEKVVAEVLDEHNKQNDEIFLTGEGTQASDVVNSGLYWSKDPNYTLRNSLAIAKDPNGSYLPGLYTAMISAIQEAQEIDGEILVLSYGDVMLGQINGMFPLTNVPFARSIQDAMEDVTFAKLPKAVTPAGAAGFIIVNLDKVTLHYTLLPGIRGQGVNEEKMYAWTNFLMGSSMLEVETKNAVIRQPITLTP